MVGAAVEYRAFQSGVRYVSAVTYFEDVPIADLPTTFGCQEPQSQAPSLGGAARSVAAGGCGMTMTPTPAGTSSEAAPQQPLLLPPRSAAYAQSSWDGTRTLGSMGPCTDAPGSEPQLWNLGLSHAVMDSFNAQASQFSRASPMPQPRWQGHVGMVTPYSVNFASMDMKQEHLNASTLRATSRTSSDSTTTSRASQLSPTSLQSWGQGHVGTATPYSANSAGMDMVTQHFDAPARYAKSRTSAESSVTPMASPSSTTFGSGSESSLPAHSAVAGAHVGTSSSVCNFAAHGPRPPQGLVHLPPGLELPGLLVPRPSLASPQWSTEHVAHVREGRGQMPAPAAANPTNLASKVLHIAEHVAQGHGEERGQMPAPLAASPTNLASKFLHIAEHVAQVRGEQHSQMPAPLAADPTNLGSQVHNIGSCTPCKFFRSRRGCKEEDRCMLCHHPHPEMTYSSMQRTMKQRSRMKRQLAQEARVVATPTPMNMQSLSVMAV